ncbi:MAG TPA: isochorismatase family protein [Ktedonobacteraceae bacterium]|jgi:nicotinamidase-related amidase|nr:isochorismatase family protein [Ktedonobacteraceae bacterium]
MTQLFDWKTTALVVIDLQKWIKGVPYTPYTSEQVVARTASLLNVFHAHNAFVALVHVSTKDGRDMLQPVLDQKAPPLNFVEGWDEIVPELGVNETDHLITKKQWGAFHGTDLDLQLRRRGITTIVLCGISAGIGVDTTAREAFQHGYQLIFAIDAITGFSQAEYDHVQHFMFPRMGRIRTAQEIVFSTNA